MIILFVADVNNKSMETT